MLLKISVESMTFMQLMKLRASDGIRSRSTMKLYLKPNLVSEIKPCRHEPPTATLDISLTRRGKATWDLQKVI